jgi:hypothetical protein
LGKVSACDSLPPLSVFDGEPSELDQPRLLRVQCAEHHTLRPEARGRGEREGQFVEDVMQIDVPGYPAWIQNQGSGTVLRNVSYEPWFESLVPTKFKRPANRKTDSRRISAAAERNLLVARG